MPRALTPLPASLDEIISADILALPEVYGRLAAKLDDPYASNGELGELIALDPGIATRVLRLANSPFYGLASTVSTVSQAISIIGRVSLAKTVLGVSVISVFDRMVAVSRATLRSHWKHSVFCGLLSRALGRATAASADGETLFMAGLLHDVGRLVLWQTFGGAAEVAGQPDQDAFVPEGAVADEVARFGWDHATVGGALLRRWQLPDPLVSAVLWHHDPLMASRDQAIVDIVCAANVMAQPDFTGGEGNSLVRRAFPSLSDDGLGEILAACRTQLDETLGYFL